MLVSGVDSRLNILHIIEPGSGGAMRHVLDLARAQADTSHAVTIIYSTLQVEAAYEAQLQALVNVKLYPLPIQHMPPASYRTKFIEVKGGHIWDRDIVRFKGCRAAWPQYEFEMWQLKKREWTRIL